MPVTLTMPDNVERRLRETIPNLESDLLETVAVNLFRAERISLFELGQMLGLTRFETDSFLAKKGILEQSLTREDLEEDYRTAKKLIERATS